MDLTTLPDWLGTALIGAVMAVAGFLGRKLYDALLARRARHEERIAELLRLKGLLEESRAIFRQQNYLARRLAALLHERLGDALPEGLGFDAAFHQRHPQMNDAERELFALIRGTTANSMRRVNEELLQWVHAWARQPTRVRPTPAARALEPELAALQRHLNLWADKFRGVFEPSERRCLVYLADEKGQGERFPQGLYPAVIRLLDELGAQPSQTAPPADG
ncbi:MAG: hypothetical protein V1772_14155 [Chloroflexota bacterium]